MILKGSQRAGARDLSDHLMNDRDNDHVELLDMRGFMADDLHGALDEAHAISKATQCKQFLFSLSLNPPQDHVATEQDFLEAADRIETKLGLTDQPRAVVVHEKEGRRHAHIVWSRIDSDEMKAINLPHFKNKLRDMSRDLYLDHGWELPKGLKTYGDRNPLNFTLAEWQQAKRLSLDPREIKQGFRQAWEHSDNLKSLSNALEERGYYLARGDRRGFVALDVHGTVFSLAKWSGVRSKDVAAKLGKPDGLRPVSDVQDDLRNRLKDQMKGYIRQVNERHADETAPLRSERDEMVQAQRAERKMLGSRQGKRWQVETKARSDRLNKGLRGIWDRMTGQAKATRKTNEAHAIKCAKRDQMQRDRLVQAQIKDRKALQNRITALRQKQKRDRQILLRDMVRYIRRQDPEQQQKSHSLKRSRDLGRSL
ncbi:relaxase/mobilization nuclease domain-containing protein [Thalassobius sp. I31.1]|uniref:relaxase/mobilization nuclease domain-containing protein n=1 Tax=Thalassobius sp. I31.1 TaxID=2109912 RepID=UPI000D1B5EAC|nr:relaxase/mobilization nuclease domain-containing protein [Thalassobius sp. I31.1]